MTPVEYALRDYQQDAIAAALRASAAGMQRILVALPTGTGKTVVGVHLAATREGRCLFLVHRDELVWQTVDKFQSVLPSLSVGVVKADRNDVAAPLVVASVQTLARPERRAHLLRAAADCGPFTTVIADEAHHATAPSWRTVLESLGGLQWDYAAMAEAAQEALDRGATPTAEYIPARTSVPGGPLVLGLTATPERGDGLALDIVWQTVAYQRSILEMIVAGHLCDLRGIQAGDEFDLSDVRSAPGEYGGRDFADGSLGDALIAQDGPARLAAAYVTHALGRKALVFVPTVEMARLTAEAFVAAGVRAAYVSAKTPMDERHALIDELRAGTLPALVNVGVLTEGFDAPCVDAILIGRPTKSRPLYTQIVGRGTRRYPGKSDCLVIDLVGASSDHKIVTVSDLAGRKLPNGVSVLEALEAAAGEQAEQQARQLAMVRRTRAVNLFAALRWTALADGRFVLSDGQGSVLLLPEDGDHCRVERRRPGLVEPLFDGRAIRIDYAQGMVEDLARREGWFRLADASAAWREQPASEKQRWFLRVKVQHERADDAALTKGEASAIRTAWELEQH